MKNKFTLTGRALLCLAAVFPVVVLAQANPLPVMGQGGQMVVGGAKEPEKKLQHWDESKPLSVSDMSEMHRKKLVEEFLMQHGYTTVEPPKAVASAPVKAKQPPPPPHVLHVRAIYGPKSSPSADVVFDGAPMGIKTGATLHSQGFSVVVKAIGNAGLEVQVPERKTPGCKPTKKKSCMTDAVTAKVAVGENVEWKR